MDFDKILLENLFEKIDFLQPPPIIAVGPANQTLPVDTIAVLPCQVRNNQFYYFGRIFGTFLFLCKATGSPRPAIRWIKEGIPLDGTGSSRIMVESTGTLVIDSKENIYIHLLL